MRRHEDALSRCHPAVSFLFFLAAIVLCVLFEHPAYLAVSAVSAALCLISLRGKNAARTLLALLPLFLLVAAVNPIFNRHGTNVLFSVFGRPYTWEALCYGFVTAGMFVTAILWFACSSEVVTGDKLTALFGSLLPALSLLLVMVLRLVPSYGKKAKQITAARRCIGKTGGDTVKEKTEGGMAVLSAMTSWALESSVVTADSMRSRGYGCGKRSSFRIYRFRMADAVLTAALLLLTAACIAAAALGFGDADFIPQLRIPVLRGGNLLGLAAYAALLLIPLILNFAEAILWHCSESKI